MRLDKYLKVTRIIKRRTVANDACDAARVTVNDRPAKASYDVKEGDIIKAYNECHRHAFLRLHVLQLKHHLVRQLFP